MLFKTRFSLSPFLAASMLLAALFWFCPSKLLAASVGDELLAPKVGAIRVEGLQAELPVETAEAAEQGKKNDVKLSHVREKEVLDLMTLRVGDSLSARRVREDIHVLFETGYFDDVQMYAESTKKKDEILLVVRLK